MDFYYQHALLSEASAVGIIIAARLCYYTRGHVGLIIYAYMGSLNSKANSIWVQIIGF